MVKGLNIAPSQTTLLAVAVGLFLAARLDHVAAHVSSAHKLFSLSSGFSQVRVRGSAVRLPPYRTTATWPLGTSPIPALPGKEQRVVTILPLQYRFRLQPSGLVKTSQALLLGIWATGHFSAASG